MNSSSLIETRRQAQRPPVVPGPRRPVDVAKERRAQVRPAPVPGELRLTRRGRLVVRVLVVLTFLMLVLAAFVMFSGRSAASGERGPEVPNRTVVVHEGDTLWGIASQVAGSDDVRDMVYRIEQLNSLPGPELVEGQELAIPQD